jgi:hypothetical protein
MLGVSDEAELSEATWQVLASRVELPRNVAAARAVRASERAQADCQRRYARKSLHSVAIVMEGDACHACHTKDISRNGVGFYSPVHLLPKKTIRLWLPGGTVFQLRVTRCRRVTERCYVVGTRYQISRDKKV